MPKPSKLKSQFLKSRLSSGIAASFFTIFSTVAFGQALPTGAEVVSGNAEHAQYGSHLSVNQSSATAIISWDQFSVGKNNSVHFDNGTGVTLNRVRGNIASHIDGSLSASGSLYLINPAGIAVGSDGRIQTGGSFIGSTLDLSDDDFEKAARGEAHTFHSSSAQIVINAGSIGSSGGDVVLIGHVVNNKGNINAPNGTAALIAGTEVLVQDRSLDNGRFVVKTGGSTTQAKNIGAIKAVDVELHANGGNVYALAGNRDGVIAATGTDKREGRIFLTTGKDGTLTTSAPNVEDKLRSGLKKGKDKAEKLTGKLRDKAKKYADKIGKFIDEL